jgi:hypothetical protein
LGRLLAAPRHAQHCATPYIALLVEVKDTPAKAPPAK